MEEWFLHCESGTAGPYTRDQLLDWIESGEITREWSIWREGMTEWLPISAVDEFSPPPVVTRKAPEPERFSAAPPRSRASAYFAILFIAIFACAAGGYHFYTSKLPGPEIKLAARGVPESDSIVASSDSEAPLFTFPAVPPARSGDTFELVAVDIGQGDALLLKLPSDEYVLIDAGPSARRLVPYLKFRGIKKLRAIVMSHPHVDHIGGIRDVIEAFEVGAIYDCGAPHTAKTYASLLELIEKKEIRYFQPRAGETLDWDKALRVVVVHPDRSDYENLNNSSIVLHITYGDISFIVTGDAEAEAEEQIVRAFGDQLKASVLKVAHHGSRSSTTMAFLGRVKPEYAVISCGVGNKFGHPRAETLESLDAVGAKVFRTDQDHSIRIWTDGKTVHAEKDIVSDSDLERFSQNDSGVQAISDSGEYSATTLQAGKPLGFDDAGWKVHGAPGDVVRSSARVELSPMPRTAAALERTLPVGDRWELSAKVQVVEGGSASFTLMGSGKQTLSFSATGKGMLMARWGEERGAIIPIRIDADRMAIRRSGNRIELLASERGGKDWLVVWTLEDPAVAGFTRLLLNASSSNVRVKTIVSDLTVAGL